MPERGIDIDPAFDRRIDCVADDHAGIDTQDSEGAFLQSNRAACPHGACAIGASFHALSTATTMS